MLVLALAAALSACGSGAAGANYPGTDAGAEALLKEFLKPGADYAALSKPLRPDKADYDGVFQPELAARADTIYTPAWDANQMLVFPKPGQTQLVLYSATTDEIKNGTGNSAEFPGGYRQVADQFKPGVKLYRFKFVEPGNDLGMAYDGLAYVNGHWRIFPKPWRLLK
jgi:hypothetical protein